MERFFFRLYLFRGISTFNSVSDFNTFHKLFFFPYFLLFNLIFAIFLAFLTVNSVKCEKSMHRMNDAYVHQINIVCYINRWYTGGTGIFLASTLFTIHDELISLFSMGICLCPAI